MKAIYRCMRLSLIIALLFTLFGPPIDAKVFRWQKADQTPQNLFLLGFGELTVHFLDVTGNENAFKLSNPNLDSDVSSNYRLSLVANGNTNTDFLVNGAVVIDSKIEDEYRTFDESIFRLKMSVESTEPIWDTWRFTGVGVYDPNRQWEFANLDTRLLTQPQEAARLELLMRLESEEHGVIEGGSIQPSFKNASFSLHNRSVFGVYADLKQDYVGIEGVAGKLEGKKFREGTVQGIRADGTSGPYDLTHAPVTQGSEEVKVQVRDRFDETTVLSSRTLIRDIDYNIDYMQGKITLHRPVASETINNDPVYIVITFDYLRDENDEIYGARGKLFPEERLIISGSYIHRNLDQNATGIGIDEPEDLIGADLFFDCNENKTKAYVEFANSQNPNSNDDYNAFKVKVLTEKIENLKLFAKYQRIEDQFRSFTNSDLDPNKNQQRINFGGDYNLSENQSISASYVNLRGLKANGQFNTYDGLREEAIYRVGYNNKLKETFGFGVKYELRDVKDRENNADEDNNQNRLIVDVGGEIKDFPLLGKFGYVTNYEHIRFKNDVAIGRNDANTNQLALTLTSQPNDRTNLELAQRVTVNKDKVLDLYDERKDATFAKAQFRPHDYLNTYTTIEYLRYTVPGSGLQLWQDNPDQIQRAGTFAIEYLPLKQIKGHGKFGRHINELWNSDTSKTTTDFALAQLTYFHTHHLSFNVETEYRGKKFESIADSRTKIWDFGIKANWNKDRFNEFTAGLIRRWQLHDASSSSEVKSSSYIVLVSGALSLTENFFTRASVKGLLLNDPLDDEKTFANIEVGYDSHKWYRMSIGYERIESDIDKQPDLNYTGQGVFVRFSGKM